MSDTAIRVAGLGKRYQIGLARERHDRLTEAMMAAVRRPVQRLRRRAPADSLDDHIWALRDVSFDVAQGEVVGIIGRNGAGKSTLLKILSRITEPTEGEVRLRGRVGSLLEVGTGFHPDLTGRENVYLNGTILGMKRAEVEAKFDEIVDFSGVSKFIDTPVKRYSSGMQVRLAFAVAAHLEPEILLIDEVLAVGDAEFQKRCLGKMGQVAGEGRTVLFVSHNMIAVESLCHNTILLENGQHAMRGPTKDVIEAYLGESSTLAKSPIAQRQDRTGSGRLRIEEASFEGVDANGSYALGDDIVLSVRVRSAFDHEVRSRISLSIGTDREQPLVSCDSKLNGAYFAVPPNSDTVFTCRITAPPLNTGSYRLNLAVYAGDIVEDWVKGAVAFSMRPGSYDGRTSTNQFPVLAPFGWTVRD